MNSLLPIQKRVYITNVPSLLYKYRRRNHGAHIVMRMKTSRLVPALPITSNITRPHIALSITTQKLCLPLKEGFSEGCGIKVFHVYLDNEIIQIHD